jgi:hypothetical protein
VSLRIVVGGLVLVAVVMVGVARLTGDSGRDANPLGTEVVVGHTDASEGQPGVRTRIGLTVLAVRRGTQEELASNGLQVGEEDKDATPYYVDARFANRGTRTVKRNLIVGLEDTHGNLIPRTLVFGFGDGSFGPCQSVAEGTLEPRESYASCTLVLVPAGVAVGRVEFLSDNGPRREPEFVYWAGTE